MLVWLAPMITSSRGGCCPWKSAMCRAAASVAKFHGVRKGACQLSRGSFPTQPESCFLWEGWSAIAAACPLPSALSVFPNLVLPPSDSSHMLSFPVLEALVRVCERVECWPPVYEPSGSKTALSVSPVGTAPCRTPPPAKEGWVRRSVGRVDAPLDPTLWEPGERETRGQERSSESGSEVWPSGCVRADPSTSGPEFEHCSPHTENKFGHLVTTNIPFPTYPNPTA